MTTSVDEIHEAAAQRVARAGGRYTAGRRRLVDVLARSSAPLTLPAILERDDRLSQSSAYRNLGELVDAGIVDRVAVADAYHHFELAELLTDHHRHHLVCRSCGAVSEFTLPQKLERELDKALSRVAATTAFDVDHHRLDLIGRCASCQAADDTA